MKMQHSNVCVWLDHRQARIIGVGLDRTDLSVIENAEIPHNIHRKADHIGLGTEPLDAAFMEAISGRLTTAGAIYLVGPGSAKVELSAHLHQRHPEISRKVWGVEPMDRVTDGELVAAASKYFRAAARMHG